MRLRSRKLWVALLACVIAGSATGIVASAVSGGNGQESARAGGRRGWAGNRYPGQGRDLRAGWRPRRLLARDG